MGQAGTASRVEVGALVANTYEIKRLLGRGGMGTVWEAHHARLPGKRVAIKVLHPEVARDADSLARFRREAEIASRIGHPNIVDVHDFNELDDGTPYLILEYLEGCSLDERLRHGPMPIAAVVSVARQVASALRAAHREGVIHRDLKPQNVFLVRTTDGDGNETEMAKVLDFGISKIRGSQTVQTQDSAILGTPQYMAPEQATGAHRSVDARTDVFALGAMVYEMLAGQPAFIGQTIPEVVFKVVYEEPTPLDQLAAVSPAIARAVHVALAKKQDDRWASVEAFIEALSGTGLSVSGGVSKVSGSMDDALASTIASGAHTPVPGVAEIGTAKTIDSGQLSPETAGLATDQTQLADSVQRVVPPPTVPATTASTGGRGARLALVIVLLLLAGGGAVAAIIAARQPDTDAVASAPADAAIAIDAAPAATPITDASATPVDAVPAVAAIDAAPPPRPKPDKPKDRDAVSKNPETSDAHSGALAEARSLVSSNPLEAIRVARRAQRDGARGEAFYAVLAMAHCKLLDLTAARAAMTRIKSRRARRQVARRCTSFGLDIE